MSYHKIITSRVVYCAEVFDDEGNLIDQEDGWDTEEAADEYTDSVIAALEEN